MRELLEIWLRELERADADDKGAVALEYAMIAGTVSLALMFALVDIEASLTAMYTSFASGF